MSISSRFVRRPVATTLLSVGLSLLGMLGFHMLPVASLPQIDFPTITVTAKQAGASPEVMAATVATPLERHLGRLAGVSQITSTSTLGSSQVTLQFDIDRDINGAARDVQGAINASMTSLPKGLQSNPTYRIVNPADAPVMALALTSKTMPLGKVYDAADSLLGQKLLQIEGVGSVTLGGSAQPAVRVEVNPLQLAHYDLGLNDVRQTIQASNLNRPKGILEDRDQLWYVQADDQLKLAADYLPLIVRYADKSAVRISDVAEVKDAVLDINNAGYYSQQPAVLILIFKKPNANVIDTIARVKQILPQLKDSLPPAIEIHPAVDRSQTIKASIAEIEHSMIIAVILVILVVFVFLRNGRATLIPAITVPISMLGTFALMYASGFSINNISLMALTVAVGFVVDDTIVVLETISRRMELGQSPLYAAVRGAKEVSMTVVSMSLSLVAVFLPILMMGGIVGRLFNEFALTLTYAILISMLVSLTTTPMLCAWWLKSRNRSAQHSAEDWTDQDPQDAAHDRAAYDQAPHDHSVHAVQAVREHQQVHDFQQQQQQQQQHCNLRGVWHTFSMRYQQALSLALRYKGTTLLLFLLTICMNIYLYVVVPKGFFPQQDTGLMIGTLVADQNISFEAMNRKLKRYIGVIEKDPAVGRAIGMTGISAGMNRANLFIALKPLSRREDSPDQVMARLRQSLATEPGAQLSIIPVQDILVGGRISFASYQYTLQSDDLNSLRTWTPKIEAAFAQLPALVDVSSDQDIKALKTQLDFDHDKMAQLGITQQQADEVLNDAFAQRQISTIYNPMNQYQVVMEVAPQFSETVQALNHLYVQSKDAKSIALSAFSQWRAQSSTLSVNHQGLLPATTLTFNLRPGYALSDATEQIENVMQDLGVPSNIHDSFQGTAQVFQSSLSSQPLLILAALLVIYIVLGILYESFVHPLTILSTLPSAGLGALLALMLFDMAFDVISLIAVLLLVGIVKKNAIMMIDVALTLQRQHQLSAEQAIRAAAMLRFRPIMMTTLVAMFAALPLALGRGEGAELHVPLGVSIVGGLLISQVLTVLTIPVIYVYMDQFSQWSNAKLQKLPSLSAMQIKNSRGKNSRGKNHD